MTILKIKNHTFFTRGLFLVFSFWLLVSPVVRAVDNSRTTTDISSSNFAIVVCDGPAGINDPKNHTDETGWKADPNFVPCDFYAAMSEIQHLINIMIVVGVALSVFGFCYAGFLYVFKGSSSESRREANGIFGKVFTGLIIMLTAWFIVYQIASWLQCGPSSTNCQSPSTALLGNPDGTH